MGTRRLFKNGPEPACAGAPTSAVSIPAEFSPRLRRFACFGVAIALLFAIPLFQWVRFCLEENLFSYALLIPFVTGWLIWQQWPQLGFDYRPAPILAGGLFLVGVATLVASFLVGAPAEAGGVARLALRLLSFVALLNAAAAWVLGSSFMRQVGFPAAFLVFMAPLPPAWVNGIEIGLQHTSAVASGWFFAWTGATYLQQGLVFQLPNITLQVAPECSGIRSTLVLFITSLIAGYLFLKRPWQRALFSALVIPLGIARNAFRIVTIGWLCTEYGPEMIHSPLHHRGGPVFFGLSLLPLFGLLFLFRWWERRRHGTLAAPVPPPGPPVVGQVVR